MTTAVKEIKHDLVKDLTTDIIQLMEDFGGYSVEFEEPFKEFCVDSLEGNYEEGLIGLISYLCHTKNYYSRLLNQEQLVKVGSMFGDENFIPALNDEEEFGQMPFEFEEVENRVTENIAVWAKAQNNEDDFPLDKFLSYYEQYGVEDMLIKLKS